MVDPFTRKDWYDIKAPGFFEVKQVGKTLVNRSQGLSEWLSIWDGASGEEIWDGGIRRTMTDWAQRMPTTR